MSGFENYFKEVADLEREIARKGIALGIDWNNPAQVRSLAQEALGAKPGAGVESLGKLPLQEHARIDLFGLAQLMLTVMRESADENLQTHGGPVWKAFGRALWQEAVNQGIIELDRQPGLQRAGVEAAVKL